MDLESWKKAQEDELMWKIEVVVYILAAVVLYYLQR